MQVTLLNIPPLRRREGILLCTCQSVGRSLSVTFSFPINNSGMPLSNVVHTYVTKKASGGIMFYEHLLFVFYLHCKFVLVEGYHPLLLILSI